MWFCSQTHFNLNKGCTAMIKQSTSVRLDEKMERSDVYGRLGSRLNWNIRLAMSVEILSNKMRNIALCADSFLNHRVRYKSNIETFTRVFLETALWKRHHRHSMLREVAKSRRIKRDMCNQNYNTAACCLRFTVVL